MMRLMIRSALDGDEVARALRNENRASWRRALHEHLSTIASEDDAAFATELVMAYVTGVTMRKHMEAGETFSDVARSEAFRDEVHRSCLELLNVSFAAPAA